MAHASLTSFYKDCVSPHQETPPDLLHTTHKGEYTITPSPLNREFSIRSRTHTNPRHSWTGRRNFFGEKLKLFRDDGSLAARTTLHTASVIPTIPSCGGLWAAPGVKSTLEDGRIFTMHKNGFKKEWGFHLRGKRYMWTFDRLTTLWRLQDINGTCYAGLLPGDAAERKPWKLKVTRPGVDGKFNEVAVVSALVVLVKEARDPVHYWS